MTPRIVVEGDADQFEQAVADVAAAGWTIRRAQRLAQRSAHPMTPRMIEPDQPNPQPIDRRNVVWVGRVENAADAAEAILAAASSAGVVAHGVAERAVLGALCDDLRHLGGLDHRVGRAAVVLTDSDRQLLDLLAAGESVGAVANRVYLSRRSVERRLASLREAFQAGSQVELLTAYRARLDAVPAPPGSRDVPAVP